VVVPSGDVTTVLMVVFAPSGKGMGPDGVPVATGTPFTVIDAVGSIAVGVTVTDEVLTPANVVKFTVVPTVPALTSGKAGVSAIVLKEVLVDGGLVTIIE
jgi:hypothetical protein